MRMATSYICPRCLRASAQLPRPNLLAHAPRAYHSRASTQFLRVRDGVAMNLRSPQAPARAMRLLSTSPSLHKPALESQPASRVEAPPPATPSAAQQYTTTTVLNPRTDEETGEAMEVSITPRAIRRLSQIISKDANPNLCLRVTVESGGCHGFQYLMSLTDVSKIDESEDVLFVASTPESPVPAGEWRVVADGRPKVVIDESSLELLKGSKVDYTMELIGSQFKIDNPRATSSCGCGDSFDIKI